MKVVLKYTFVFIHVGDVGDHVVVFNTRAIAMKDDLWKTKQYHHHSGLVNLEVW